ncbi:MAG: hypothetical protein IJA69_04310 [Clostridia bacterium]|nr:hypothetical protein [Clostridia bacterium]
MEEKIRLSYGLAKAVWQSLNKQGIETRRTAGLMSDTFSREELEKVTALTLSDNSYSIKGISHLKNLKTLFISTTAPSHYASQKDVISITDEEIIEIEQLSNLEHLSINNQREIHLLDILNFPKLCTLEITRCENLEAIVGLKENKTLSELVIYDVNSMPKIDGLDKFIEQNQNLTNLNLDVMFFPNAIGYRTYGAHNENALKILDSMIDLKWTESVSAEKTDITHNQMKNMHKKACEIVAKHCKSSHDIEKVAAVNEYIARNIKYNYSALDSTFRGETKGDQYVGPKKGANGAYNALMFNSCVCEGYTRAMQYLLNLVGVRTANTHCIAGKDTSGYAEKSKESASVFRLLPKDGFHSICRIERESGIFYCDPCWNAGRYQKGDKSMPWLLLTKEQIAKTHTLSCNEQNSAHQKPIPKDVIDYAKQNVQKTFENEKDLQYNN